MDVGRLAERAQAGDVDAFTDLVRRYQAMALGYALATTGDPDLAEDAAQQAFITAWRTLGSLRHPERFGGWLRGIVRYECLHLLRARRHPALPLDAAHGVAAPDPADLAGSRAAQDDILAAFGALPQRERVAATLYYLHDHSQRDVANFLDLPIATVNNRLRNARKRLRQEGLTLMAHDMFDVQPVAPDFADRIGEVIRGGAAVIDARIRGSKRPAILNQVTIAGPDSGIVVTAQVGQYLDDDLIRCFPVGEAPGDPAAMRAGAAVHDSGGPTSLPMDLAALHRVVGHVRGTVRPATMTETGIKAIDICCPLGSGALVAVAGDMRVGKMVLVGELIHRLEGLDPPVTVVIFVEATTEVLAIQALDYQTSGSVEAIYLPVADASPEALAPVLNRFDAVIALSRELGRRGLYPAIDPMRSWSRLLDGMQDGNHRALVDGLRSLLAGGSNRARAEAVQYYLSQPFFTAEPWTNQPGVTVPLATALSDLRSLLAGEHDALDPSTLAMRGALVER